MISENKISFGAKFINPINVRKLKEKSYNQAGISFVEINPLCADDVSALKYIAEHWEKDKYAINISNVANMIFKGKSSDKTRIYALTTQGDSFEKLNPDKILGVVEAEEFLPFYIHINRFQVKPEYINKGFGTAILNSLEEIYRKISLIAENDEYVKKFYERNGFYETSNGSNFYTWYKDYFADIFKIYR